MYIKNLFENTRIDLNHIEQSGRSAFNKRFLAAKFGQDGDVIVTPKRRYLKPPLLTNVDHTAIIRQDHSLSYNSVLYLDKLYLLMNGHIVIPISIEKITISPFLMSEVVKNGTGAIEKNHLWAEGKHENVYKKTFSLSISALSLCTSGLEKYDLSNFDMVKNHSVPIDVLIKVVNLPQDGEENRICLRIDASEDFIIPPKVTSGIFETLPIHFSVVAFSLRYEIH